MRYVKENMVEKLKQTISGIIGEENVLEWCPWKGRRN
jgi:hypothetical protein